MKILSGATVGRLRRLLMVRGDHRWNGWVRGITAKLG